MSTQSTTPHPLESLLEIWQRVSQGQRQAIARDFHIRTGGLMSTTAETIVRVLPLIPVWLPATSSMPENTMPEDIMPEGNNESGKPRKPGKDDQAPRMGQFGLVVGKSGRLLCSPLSWGQAPSECAARFLSDLLASSRITTTQVQLPQFQSFGEPVTGQSEIYLLQAPSTVLPEQVSQALLSSPACAVVPISEVSCQDFMRPALASWSSVAPARYGTD